MAGSSSSDTGDAATASTSTSSGPDTGDSSTGDAVTSTSEAPATCGNGLLDPGETCDTTQETKLCDDDCSPVGCGDGHVNVAAGEGCDDGNVVNTDACLDTCTPASCGDGNLWPDGEECDDGNTAPGDGCDEVCARERWSHVGVAKGVAVADLYLWEPCWSDTYEAGDLLSGLVDACTGDHLLFACRPLGSDTLTLAAHAPRADVVFEAQVNYTKNERHQANGVSWYWAPQNSIVGFGPGSNAADCLQDGEDNQMCWGISGNIPQKFVAGWRCGEVVGMSVAQTTMWERVVLQAWE